MQRQADDLLDLRRRDRRLAPPPRPNREKFFKPSSKPLPPRPTVAGDTPTSLAIRVFANPSEAINNALRSLHITVRRGLRPRSTSPAPSLLVADRSGGVAARMTHLPQSPSYFGYRPLGTVRKMTGSSLPPTLMLTGTVVVLRPFKASDVPAIVAACRDPATYRYMPDPHALHRGRATVACPARLHARLATGWRSRSQHRRPTACWAR